MFSAPGSDFRCPCLVHVHLLVPANVNVQAAICLHSQAVALMSALVKNGYALTCSSTRLVHTLAGQIFNPNILLYVILLFLIH